MPQPPAFTREMEDDVLGLLGGLLGLLEVLSIDVREPLTTRQQSVMNDALKFGDRLRARIEAMVTLLGDERDPRYQPSDYSLRRLIDHAVRGANWTASEKGVRLVLPDTEAFGQETVRIDATRVDRAVRAITDALVAHLGRGHELLVEVSRDDRQVVIELRANSAEPLLPFDLPRLSVLAFERVFALHGGHMLVNRDKASVRIELARGEQG